MNLSFVVSEIEFIGKDNKAGLQTLRIQAQKVLIVKMPFQTPIILEKLIGQILVYFTHVTLVMIFIQMLMQVIQIIKTLGSTKFTQGMSFKPGSLAVALGQVLFELGGRKAW